MNASKEPGQGWADAVLKILRMGKNNPESNRILCKAKIDRQEEPDASESDDSDAEYSVRYRRERKSNTKRLKPDPQANALLENELKSIATRGVVHLFNAVKTVNPATDKRKKKKKKKKRKIKKGRKGFARRRT